MADLITTLGNRDRILIDDFSIAPDTTYSSEKILDLIKTFDSVVRCSIPLVEPIGSEGTYDSTYLTILIGEIGERVLVTAPNGLGTVSATAGNIYTVRTVYLCTWETLTGKPFETLSAADFTVDNGALHYVDKWTAPINDVDDRKQDKVPETGSSGYGYTQGAESAVNGVQIRIDSITTRGSIAAVSLVYPDAEYPADPAGTFDVPGGTGGKVAVASSPGKYAIASIAVGDPGQDYLADAVLDINGIQVKIDGVDPSGGITAVSLVFPDAEYPADPDGTFDMPGGTGGTVVFTSAVSAYTVTAIQPVITGTGRYTGKRDSVTGDSVWEELDEFSLVNSVNGVFPENMPFGKNVQLDAAKINVDDAAGTPMTVKDAIVNIATVSSADLTDAAASNALPATGLIQTVLQTIRNCLKWLTARFDTSGNANAALKLTAARTIRTNLASTSAVNFDGSANVTPGVTGTLPAANGGTGRTDGRAPALVTARSIQTNLASTSAVNFDGSANVTPGVTGTLPAANGGTGRTDGRVSYAENGPDATASAHGWMSAADKRKLDAL